MNSHAAIIRLRDIPIDGQRRKIAQLRRTIAEFEQFAAELDCEVRAEQDRTGIHDPSHYAYSTYARAARQRRDNLKRSVAELRIMLDDARRALRELAEQGQPATPPSPPAGMLVQAL